VDLEELMAVADNERSRRRVLPLRPEVFLFGKVDNDLDLFDLFAGKFVLVAPLEERVLGPGGSDQTAAARSTRPRGS
jgi:hypothetical protein